MKPLAKAKQRLAPLFNLQERRDLSLAMLADVVKAGAALDQVWVICSDDDAVDVARQMGAIAVPDHTPDDGLNSSIAATTQDALSAGARGMLLVSADCALATPQDCSAVALGHGIVVSPNSLGTGTNALWRQPCDIIPTWFGPKSRRAHQGLAYARQLPFARIPRLRLATDIDTPRDLDIALKIGVGEFTAQALRKLGYPSTNGGL
jgi:2-phospho-L-lactate/phosphoenolpyruvate guanylyltransferase